MTQYVKCIYSNGSAITVNKIYKYNPIIDDDGDVRYHPMSGALFEYIPATEEEYNKQENIITTKETMKKFKNKISVSGSE